MKTNRRKGGFEFYGGCTMIFDLDKLTLKYAISKPLLSPDKLRQGNQEVDVKRIMRQHNYQTDEGILSLSEQSLYFGTGLQKQFFQRAFCILA
jgi:hypothetical protein